MACSVGFRTATWGRSCAGCTRIGGFDCVLEESLVNRRMNGVALAKSMTQGFQQLPGFRGAGSFQDLKGTDGLNHFRA